MANDDPVTAVKSKSVFDYLNDWGSKSLTNSVTHTISHFLPQYQCK